MRLFTLILIFSLLFGSTFSQIVKGCIIDMQTREAVPFAAVYFAGTFLGTSSDQEGIFQIDVTSFISMPLAIFQLAARKSSFLHQKYTRLERLK